MLGMRVGIAFESQIFTSVLARRCDGFGYHTHWQEWAANFVSSLCNKNQQDALFTFNLFEDVSCFYVGWLLAGSC
jgi:hypothetical protein